MKLSERLEADAELIHNNGITRKLRRHRVAALLREAAELARRVEDAPVADIRDDGKNGGESALLSAATRAGYYQGQRVRIVPDTPTPPDPGHEREGA